jgi:hypothetical protein
MIDGERPAAPRGVHWTALAVVGGVMVVYFEGFHEIARALVGGFGSAGTSVSVAVVATMIGALPLVALIPITRLPTWWWTEGLPFARAQRGECPDCGYPAQRYPCPECGGDGNLVKQPLVIGLEVGRAISLVAIAMLAGILIAEWRVRTDEARFVEEARAIVATGGSRHERPRAGWGGFTSLEFDAAQGYTARPPFTSTLIPGLHAHERPVKPRS